MGEAINLLGSTTLLSLFVMMIVSPKTFFVTVDQIIRNKVSADEIEVEVVNPLAITHTSLSVNAVNDFEKRIKLFDSAIKKTKNKQSQRIWKLKREQYLRHVRWQTLVENSGATERITR
jgi:hypothetical protein